MWFTVVLGLVVGLPAPLLAQRPADFGQQWVRSHPYLVGGYVNAQCDPSLFTQCGLNTIITGSLAYPENEKTIRQYTSQGYYPWYWELDASSLTQAVKDEANYIYRNYAYGQGFNIMDEPYPQDFAGMGTVATWLRGQFPNALVYANCQNYLPNTKYKIDLFVDAVHPDVLAYDYHPFRETDGVPYETDMSEYFQRAMIYREKALQYNLPYFTCIQAFDEPSSTARYSSESELRVQMFAFLTMGCKGFTYFRYQGVTGLLTGYGASSESPMYAMAASANPEVSNLGKSLRFATTTAVGYVRGPGGNSLPAGLSNWSAGMGGDSHIADIQVLGSGAEKNGLIGFFTDDRGQELFMLTNLNHSMNYSAAAATVEFSISFDSSVNNLLCLDRLTGQQTVVALNNHVLDVFLPGGTGNLYKYNNGIGFLGVPEPGSLALLATGLLGLLAYGWRKRR